MEKRVLQLVKLAILLKASDIHIEQKDSNVEIKLRVVDGFKKIKTSFEDLKLISYLQYIAKLDVGNRLKPQTGQFEIVVDKNIVALRFSYINNNGVISTVLRVLNTTLEISLETLSLDENDLQYFRDLLLLKEGLVIFSGPTGSGKTTTLYTLLRYFKNRKIITVEDPVEVTSDLYLQLQINEKADFDYNAAIKQILRHDPDVIMIGEIRDEIAAKAALRAANTGHLVLTSIHAPSCKLVINRLIDLGIAKHQLQVVLKQIYNQRLFKTEGGKGVLYEIWNEQELEHYFKKEENSKHFIPLSEKIVQAISKKKIIVEN